MGKFLEQHGEGLHHLALHVDDISGTFEEMKQAGVRLLSNEIEIGAGGRLHFLVTHWPRTACCWKSARILFPGFDRCF